MNSVNDTHQQREVIEAIRRFEYGVGVETSEENQRIQTSLRSKLNRTLKLLADDLYTKETHFVLELIQNADDNAYPEGALPRLSFQLSPERLLLVNNEIGFNESNVQALCDVGKSSKENKKGYIGEKGIGFKSVFNVSDAPEIHSNGYHFRFNRTDPENLLGYVVPEWCDSEETLFPNDTLIILPAKLGKQFSADTLQDLDASLLLFLAKLREFDLKHEDGTRTFSRHDYENFSHLKSTVIDSRGTTLIEESRFLRVSTAVSMQGADDEKRPENDISEVVLAFPVDSRGKASPQASSQVFAFLPIGLFGFKFAIQADYILSSSREAIHIDRKWNQRLRDSIAIAFVKAVDDFKSNKELSFSYLQFLPKVEELLDPFFKPVASQILALLSEMNCLLSVSGRWRLPAELRFGNKKFQRLFPSPVAQTIFGFDYLDNRVVADENLLKRLGAKPISATDIIGVFKHHGDWLSTQSSEWKAKWYAFLADSDSTDLLNAGLMSTRCIPINSGAFAVPNKTSVFYPLNRGRKYGFERELTIVDGELLQQASVHSTQIDGFFAALLVKKDDPFDLVNSHILPRHKSGVWQQSDKKALIGHLRYIKDKFDQYLAGAVRAGKSTEDAIKAVRDDIWIGTKKKTDNEWNFNRTTNVYLSKEYQPRFCIEGILGDELPTQLLISSEYLSAKTVGAESEIDSWRQFLVSVGVCETPKIETLTNRDIRCSAELQALLDSPQTSVRRSVLECLDRNWDFYSSKLIFPTVEGRRVVNKDTKFWIALTSMKAPTKKHASIPLRDAYYPSREIKELFGDKPVYLDVQLTRTDFLQACKVTHSVDVAACIKRLRELKTDGGDTSSQLHAIYRHLERLWDKDSVVIKQAFHFEDLIRVKGPHATWSCPKEVTWRPSGSFLDSLYPPLEGQYRDFSSFFVQKLGVSKELPTSKMVAALCKLDELDSVEERAREAIAIYKRVSRDLVQKSGRQILTPEWLDTFLSEAVFLNQRGELVENDENLFSNDSPELGALFEDHLDISLLIVPFEDLPRVQSLLDAAGVLSLANSATKSVIETAEGHAREDLAAKVRSVFVPIVRALYHKSHVAFEKALERGFLGHLRNIKVVEVPHLQVEVTVANVSRVATWDIAACGNRILFKHGARSIVDLIAIEICKMLEQSPDELADMISRLLLAEDAEAVEDFLRVRQISALPPDVEKALFEEAPEPQAGSGPDESRNSDGDVPEEKVCAGAESCGEDTSGVVGLSISDVPPSGAKVPQDRVASANGLAVDSNLLAADQSPKQISSLSPPHERLSSNKNDEHLSTDAPESTSQAFERSAPDKSNAATGARGETMISPGPVAGYTPETKRFKKTPEPQLSAQFDHPKSMAPDSRGSKREKSYRTSSGRLMSYAASPADAERASKQEDPAKTAARDATGQAAVEYFLLTQGARWKSLLQMSHNNPGFDIKAVSHDDQDEFIEVKGQSGAWTEDGVGLTPTEMSEARLRGDRYWLCVVEYATNTKRRKLYLLKNPYGLTQQFRFDSGWKSAAHSETATPTRPEAGLSIELPGLGKGRILSAKRKGKFYSVHVTLESGIQVNRIFNPATMFLSAE